MDTLRLRPLKVYATFTYPFACIPFLYFWFAEQGIDDEEYGLLIATYYLTMWCAEVPTGILADRWGRKAAMVLGPMVLAAGFVTLMVWRQLTGFVVAEALMGIGHALLSGPPSALLFDALARAGRQHEFRTLEGRLHGWRLTGTGLAFLLGGGLATVWGLTVTIPVTAGLCTVASVAAWTLTEPPRPSARSRRLLHLAWQALRDPQVRWLAVYFVLLFVLLRYAFHDYQPYLRARVIEDPGRPEEGWPLLVGALFFALNLVATWCSRRAAGAERRFGLWPLLWAMPLLMVASLFLLTLPLGPAAVLLFAVQQIPFGMHWPLVQDLVNQRLGTEARTTVLSVLSLLGRLSFSVLCWPLFLLQEHHGIEAAFLVAGTTGLLLTITVMTRR